MSDLFFGNGIEIHPGKNKVFMFLCCFRIVAILCVIALTLLNSLYIPVGWWDRVALKLAGAAVYASFFEWVLHRYPMHRPKLFGLKFEYAFRAHAIVHHHTFKFDHTYHLMSEKDKHVISMAWWNWFPLVVFATSPFIVWSWLFHGSWVTPPIVAAVALAYYGAYERFHWCMHLPRVPKRRLIERSWVFFRLNGHHVLHHKYMHRNFNVILPIADLCLGTLCVRSKVPFVQVRGPSVPDVQPKKQAGRRVPVRLAF